MINSNKSSVAERELVGEFVTNAQKISSRFAKTTRKKVSVGDEEDEIEDEGDV